MALTIIQNAIGYVNPSSAILDTGWTISDVYASHVSCNAGIIKSMAGLGLVIGREYTITYTVDNYISGSVKVIVGANNGISRTANGTYTETLVCTSISQLSFYSDGALRISILKFFDTEQGLRTGRTISFHEGTNTWGSDYSYQPELMIKFINQFLTIQNGQLWSHDTNALTNNFYGVQYPYSVTFVVNVDYKKDKIYYNMRLDSRGNWSAPVITTRPSDQFPNGMLSRIKTKNFKRIDGKKWATILSDINDPNFANITDPDVRALKALFGGRRMQGGWMIVTLQGADITTASIASVEIFYDETSRGL